MTSHTLEGTWEEVAKNAKTLKGKRVKVTVYDDDDVPGPNKEALKVIREVEKKQKNMRFTRSLKSF